MIVEPFAADPAFPGLQTAGDPDAMRELLADHLRPVGGTAHVIEDCKLFRVRYRKGARCVLQYALGLVHPVSGATRTQWVTGVMYAGGKTRRKWEKLKRSDPKVPGADPAFEPFSYIPELDMLVEVFPYDRRLPGLPLLMAGRSPELEAPVLARFGPDRRVEAWDVELVRYRAELGATIRLTVRADGAGGLHDERRFYAKVYHDDGGEQTLGVLRDLGDGDEQGEPFSVGHPVAYLEDPRILIQEETPGVTLRDILLTDEDADDRAVRHSAEALAALHLADVEPRRLHPLADEVRSLRRTGKLLRWACPHLATRVEDAVGAVISGLEDVPPAPTHRDLKLDHILLDADRVGFIDLDGFAGADPLLDTANVLAHLGGMSLLFPGFDEDRGRAHERNFAEEYFDRVPEAWRAGLPTHLAGANLKMAVGFFRRREAGWPAKIEALLDTARDALANRTR